MEKAAGAGRGAGIRGKVAPGCLAALAVSLLCTAAPAQEAGKDGTSAQRADLALVPFTRSGDAPSLFLANPGPGPGAQALGLQSRGAVDVGLHWSPRLENLHQIDVSAWRRMNAPDDAYSQVQLRNAPLYGARVEMNLARPKSGLLADKGFLGFQMESGARITMKRKDGISMLYYRTGF